MVPEHIVKLCQGGDGQCTEFPRFPYRQPRHQPISASIRILQTYCFSCVNNLFEIFFLMNQRQGVPLPHLYKGVKAESTAKLSLLSTNLETISGLFLQVPRKGLLLTHSCQNVKLESNSGSSLARYHLGDLLSHSGHHWKTFISRTAAPFVNIIGSKKNGSY